MNGLFVAFITKGFIFLLHEGQVIPSFKRGLLYGKIVSSIANKFLPQILCVGGPLCGKTSKDRKSRDMMLMRMQLQDPHKRSFIIAHNNSSKDLNPSFRLIKVEQKILLHFNTE